MIYRIGKYRIEGRIINTETDKVVPDDIPLFLFLGTDKRAPGAIGDYFDHCQNQRHAGEGFRIALWMQEWQRENPDRVHEPDGRI